MDQHLKLAREIVAVQKYRLKEGTDGFSASDTMAVEQIRSKSVRHSTGEYGATYCQLIVSGSYINELSAKHASSPNILEHG